MSAMDYRDVDTSNCSVGRAVELVGQPWVMLILREVSQGVRRFSDMQDAPGRLAVGAQRPAGRTWWPPASSSCASTRSPASAGAPSTT